MSRSMASLSRTPASKPSSTMSTRRSSIAISISTRGWRARNAGTTGSIANGTAVRGIVSRSRPTASPGFADTSVSAASACSSPGPALPMSRLPASVREKLRVVRASRTTRSCSSSWRTAWLTADLDTPSSRAALVKLRRRATARTAWSCGKSAGFMAPSSGGAQRFFGGPAPVRRYLPGAG
jgi:hypothetical protein